MKHINIVGCGVNILDHLTLNAITVLGHSELVLALVTNAEIEILSKYCLNIVNITPLYKDGDKDTDNYYRIYKNTISHLEHFNNITLLVPGHPRLGVTLTQLFEIQSEKCNYTISVIPGISSFDTMLNDLKIDPLERGVVIIDVNRMMLFDYPINTALDHFFYHICSIGNEKTEFSNPNDNNKVSLLKKYLQKFYSPTKKITMIQSQSLDSTKMQLTESTLEDIDLLLNDVNFSCSLFIQGDIEHKQINREFYSLLTSKECYQSTAL